MHLQDDEDGITGSFKFNAELFEPATVERMARCWLTLLESAAADPSSKVSRLMLLDAGERERTLALGRGAERPVPDLTLAQLFEAQVERTPDAPAVRVLAADGSSQSLSFAALNQRANRLAFHLRSQGVQPGALVGVCLNRSVDLVAALLGTMKAGAAYLPMDPAYPARRLAMIREDAAPACVLTAEDLQAAGRDGLPRTNPPRVAQLDDVAYVIYTSGSTGQPKGTLVTHRGLTNYLLLGGRRIPRRRRRRRAGEHVDRIRRDHHQPVPAAHRGRCGRPAA